MLLKDNGSYFSIYPKARIFLFCAIITHTEGMNIFQDESGCLGFEAGSSKFYVVALLCTENSKRLGNVIRKFKGRLIKSGWPNDLEIKAHHLITADRNREVLRNYRYKDTPEIPIFDILRKLVNCDIEIDAIVVLKTRISDSLRTLPHGMLHNYYSGRVLIDRIVRYDEVHLYVDETSKQTHDLRHFDGYIKTGALLTKGHSFPFEIVHADSNVVAGVSAADFICWALFRRYEYNDPRYFDLFKHKVATLKRFYFR